MSSIYRCRGQHLISKHFDVLLGLLAMAFRRVNLSLSNELCLSESLLSFFSVLSFQPTLPMCWSALVKQLKGWKQQLLNGEYPTYSEEGMAFREASHLDSQVEVGASRTLRHVIQHDFLRTSTRSNCSPMAPVQICLNGCCSLESITRTKGLRVYLIVV